MQKCISFALPILIISFISGCQKGREQHPADPTPISKPELIWINDADLAKVFRHSEQDVIYLATPPMVVDKMLEMAQVKKDDLLYDLGCGDGRIAIAAAQRYGCRAVGFEIDKELVERARENVKKHSLEHLVRIEQKDIFELDLSRADVIAMYLTADLDLRLLPQLEQLKPGSRIVSHDWDIRGIKPDIEIQFTSKVPDFVNVHMIYLWTTPLKKIDESQK